MSHDFIAAADLQLFGDEHTECLVATLNLVFDDSGKQDKAFVVYGGILIDGPGSGPEWDELRREWALLLHNAGVTCFHAKEAFTFSGEWSSFKGREPERDNLLRSLAMLSQQYPREINGAIITTADFMALSHVQRKRYKNISYCAFEQGIVHAVESARVLPEDNFILICDDSEGESAENLALYRRLRIDRPDIARRIGSICFADDRRVPALQMADMISSCFRKRAENSDDGIWKELITIFMPDESKLIQRPIVL